MPAPRLVLAAPIGQTSVRALFDQPMREIGVGDDRDARSLAVWSVGGGLPDIIEVIKNSDVEFELVLEEPAPLAAGYSITVDASVESAAGEAMDLGVVTQVFDVTVADLTLDTVLWVNASTVDLVFSNLLAPIAYDEVSEVLTITPTDGGVQRFIIGLVQSGATLRVTLSGAGTAGATYLVTLTRELFADQSSGVLLKQGDQSLYLWGQGSFPSIVTAAATETSFQATISEALGFGPMDAPPTLPLFIGAYSVSTGDLGSDVELGTVPSIVRFPSASFTLGENVTWSFAKTSRSVAVGQSWASQASSTLGDGSETVGVGVTTLSKTAGDPFELVFSGGSDSLTRSGRRTDTTLAITFPASVDEYPLVAFTFLNTHVSVVIKKTAANSAVLQMYRGSNPVGDESGSFNPAVAFTLSFVDATSDSLGFFAVLLNGQVVLGATASELLDTLLIDTSAGATAIAVTLGSPLHPTQTFSIAFSSALSVQSFLATGLIGQDSRDILSFSGSQITTAAGASATPPLSPGYQGTGVGAFGVNAEYLETIDAIQVVVGLNTNALPLEFTGSVSLLTGQQAVIDQLLVDQTNVLVDENEFIVVFLHPKSWLGTLVGVALEINGSTYSVVVPVTDISRPMIQGQLTQQPASWPHPRGSLHPADAPVYGPATIQFGQ